MRRLTLGLVTASLLVGSASTALDSGKVDSIRSRFADDPGSARLEFDSLLVMSELDDPATRLEIEELSRVPLDAAADSAWLRDLEVVTGLGLDDRVLWLRAVTLDARATSLRAAGEFDDGESDYREAIDVYQRVGDLRREAVAHGSLGVLHWYAGDLDAVRAAYLNALDARERLGDPALIGATLNGLGSVHIKLGQYDVALGFLRRALEVRRRIGNPLHLARTITYIGNAHYRRYELIEAESRYREALSMLPDDAPAAYVHQAMDGLANVYDDLGESRRALGIYADLDTLLTEMGDERDRSLNRQHRAAALTHIGDYAGALRELHAAVATQEEQNDTRLLAGTLLLLGAVYDELGHHKRAIAIHMRARELAEAANDRPTLADAITNAATSYFRLGDYESSLRAHEEAMAIREELSDPIGVAGNLTRMGDTRDAQGDHEAALDLYRRALRRYESRGLATLVTDQRANVGNALNALDRVEEARESFRQAVKECEATDRNEALWRAYLGLADGFERRNELEEARTYNARAQNVLDRLWDRGLSAATKVEFVRFHAFLHEAQVHVLGKLHDAAPGDDLAADAFAVAERGKARALRDLLTEDDALTAGVGDEMVTELRAVERELHEIEYRFRAEPDAIGSMADLRDQRGDLERRRDLVLERMRLQNPALAGLDPTGSASVASVREDLLSGGNRLLLAYSLGDSASYLWAIYPDRLSFHRLAGRAEITALVRKLRIALRSPGPATDEAYLDAAGRLRHELLSPVAADIAAAELVYIVPDGALHYLPFEVLPIGNPAAITPTSASERRAFYRDLTYVFGDTPVRYGPSATALAILDDRSIDEARPPRELLAIGDPAFGGSRRAAPTRGVGLVLEDDELRPLPFTREEVNAIAELFDADERTVLTGSAARESALTRERFVADYRLLHLATHGLIDDEHPDRSSLALAFPSDSNEDGYLTAREIRDLDLRADLVVLSACETGLGRIVRGEGVIGLPRSFLFAGARSVIVSLWSVSDRSTALFMEEFYRRIVTDGDSPAAALVGARAALRAGAEFAHPFFWGPFVLVGP